MITLFVLNITVLLISIFMLISLALVSKPNKAHILYAIFCGSIAFLMSKHLLAESITPYHYLIGIGASATCNSYWLFSRTLFRRRNAIELPHVIVAVAISLLIVLNQLFMFLEGMNIITLGSDAFGRFLLLEFAVLLSSFILVLTFWEGCRGYNKENSEGKRQRIFFLFIFVCALVGSRIAKGLLGDNPQALEYMISIIILFVIISTQILLVWKYSHYLSFLSGGSRGHDFTKSVAFDLAQDVVENEASLHSTLAQQVKDLIIGKSLFLQESLKICDIAYELGVSEYLVSKAIRNDLGAGNFNQYVNALRIEHARKLLMDPLNRKKSILVISFDSGFSSIGPFIRAFKKITGLTPSEYRQVQLGK